MARVKTRPTCDCYKPVNNGKSFMLIESLKENNGGLNEFWSYLWKFCHWCGAPAEEVE